MRGPCFHAHQAAEKALKALLMKEAGRYEPIHGVRELLELCRGLVEVSDELLRAASKLDSHYIPPRYPNAWPSGPSYVHYGEGDAEEAVSYASRIVELAKRRLGLEG